MNLHEYAEALLFGRTIEEKLFRPTKIINTSVKPAQIRFPAYPNRPSKLSLQAPSKRYRVWWG